jgi:hypothetical protein
MAQARAPGGFLSRPGLLLAVAAALAVALTAGLIGRGDDRAQARPIGLFTSLPIVWRETDDLAQLLRTEAPSHWALAVLKAHGRLRALDTLTGNDGTLPLARRALLVMAQPRPLSPTENVALDDWVRGGGHVLLFADPMLTVQSAFALGDKRRPQDVALLSPILDHWGLGLQFDENQPFGEREAELLGARIPVNLAGHFVARSAACAVQSEGLAARCRIGAGEVTAVADAALWDAGTAGDAGTRAAMLERLLTLSAR